MKKKSKWTQQRDDFFQAQFKKRFTTWHNKDPKKNTQGEFARQICEIMHKKTGEKCPVTNSYVSEWLRGVWFPEMYLPAIAEVLGVKEEDFIFHTHDELWRLSSEYMTKTVGGEMKQFCEELGLDLRFLFIISELIGSKFDDMFPTWTPFKLNKKAFIDDKEDLYYRPDRKDWIGSAEMDSGYNIFQCKVEYEEDGQTKEKLLPFSRPDLRFLKDVQDKVKDYIEFLMLKQSKDLKRDVRKASEKARITLSDGGKTTILLNAEELNKIDTYCEDYSDQKEGVK